MAYSRNKTKIVENKPLPVSLLTMLIRVLQTVETHTRPKSYHFGRYDAEAKLFCQKGFRSVTRAGVFIWKNFNIPVTEISVTRPVRLLI